jgi:hypothetical protein
MPYISKNSDINWQNDDIQFPRLLAEIRAIGLKVEQYRQLRQSMDLSVKQIDEILERAELSWQSIKDSTE